MRIAIRGLTGVTILLLSTLSMACSDTREVAPGPTTTDIDAMIQRALESHPQGLTQEDVTSAIQQALAAQPGVSQADIAYTVAHILAQKPAVVTHEYVTSAIQQAMATVPGPGLNEDQVADAVSRVLSEQSLVTEDQLARAIDSAMAEVPWITRSELLHEMTKELAAQSVGMESRMAEAIRGAMAERASVTEDQIAEAVAEALEKRPVVTQADIEAAIESVLVRAEATGTIAAPSLVNALRPSPKPAIGPIEWAKYGGAIMYVPQGSIRIIDPMATGAIVTGTVGRHAYDQLFWRDSSYYIHPQMLEAWELSEDGKQYTFRVRAGQKFHNGNQLRMVDIAESHNRFARVDPLGRRLLGISSGNVGKERSDQRLNQAVDEANNTIVMKFEQPTAMVPEFLAQLDPRQPSIMHEDIWSIPVGQPVDQAIGTGAFMLTEWLPQERLVFEQFADYVPNRGEPWDFTKGEINQYIDGFVALDIPDHTTRVAALQTGEVDVLDDFRLDLAFTLDGNPNIVWSPIRDGNYGVHGFNFHHPPFDMTGAGRLARQAVYAASPHDMIMQAAVGERRFWKECYAEIHCGTGWTTVVSGEVQEEGIKTLRGNLGLARQILDQAAQLDPKIREYPVRLVAASDMPFMPEAGLVMAETLKQLGFANVELLRLDWSRRLSLTGNPDGAWEMATSWSNFANGLNPLAPSMAVSSPPGSGRWVEPGMTELRQRFLTEMDPGRQQELFDEMNRVLYDNPARIWHFMFSPPRAARAEVKNFCLDCLFPIPHNVWLDR